MYEITRKFVTDKFGKKDFGDFESIEEISAERFAILICRRTNGNHESGFQYMQTVSNFPYGTLPDGSPNNSWRGDVFIWGDGLCLFSLMSNKGGLPQQPLLLLARFCNHTYVDEKIGRCLNKYSCTKCGYSYMVDSSD